MEDKAIIEKILDAGGSITINGRRDRPLSERLNATFSERTPRNSGLIRSVLESGGSVTISPAHNAPKS